MLQAPDLTGDTPYQWQDDAACAETDPDMFFPDMGDWLTSKSALEICGTCPVVQQCKALGMQFEHGIFGGMSARSRGIAKRSKK